MQIDAVVWPDSPWPMLREEWVHAEAIGIGRGWLYDHLLLDGRPIWHDALVTLSAAAASTTSIGLGTMVTSPNFRHPVTTAKAALALDAVSGGRFVLGIGAGGPGGDSDAMGGPELTRGQRTARFEEWTATAADLLAHESVDRDGTFVSVRNAAVGGGTPGRPLVAVAGTGRRGMAVAARHAGLWITQDSPQDPRAYAGSPYAEVQRQLRLLDDVCLEVGRDPASLPRLVVLGYGGERPLDSIESFRDCIGRYADLGVATVAVLWPRGEEAESRMAVLEAGLADLPGRQPVQTRGSGL